MNNAMKCVVLLPILFVVGCATNGPDKIWVKPGTSVQQTNQMLNQCKYQASIAMNGALPINPMLAAQFANLVQGCMYSGGWALVPSNQGSSANLAEGKLTQAPLLNEKLDPKWVKIGESDGIEYHADSKNVKISNAGTARNVIVWTMATGENIPGAPDPRIKSVTMRNEIRCANDTSRISDMAAYPGKYGTGQIIDFVNTASPFSGIAPDSMVWNLKKIYCN